MAKQREIWCDDDEHKLYEHFVDFNEWLDSNQEDVQEILINNCIETFSYPSKVLYAGDKKAYEETFLSYRIQRRHEVLSKEFLNDTCGDDHWFERNEERFNQLIARLVEKEVVPFIGAGISAEGGFPTWKDHLRQQGRTAGVDKNLIDTHLKKGDFEYVVETIEAKVGQDVFAQEIRDVFSKTGSLTDITLLLPELFTGTLITTNYDNLIEQAFDTGIESTAQVMDDYKTFKIPDQSKTTIIKLHGDTKIPKRCILGKNQYTSAYGKGKLDLNCPIPKLLQYYFLNRSLLFLGCSLNNDRTIHVFRAVKATAGDKDLPQHFSIEQAPELEGELRARNTELLNLGITPIWYAKGQYKLVGDILRHAGNEVKYRKSGKESVSKQL